jgi:cytidyltransferase-like protein
MPYTWANAGFVASAVNTLGVKLKSIMVTGYFQGFHNDHLAYLEKAKEQGLPIICVVASDAQLLLKKRKVNITEDDRCQIVRLILNGMEADNLVCVNIWDKDTTITEALRFFKPTVLLRGFDKSIETMPESEKQACDELGIQIIHARDGFDHNLHSSEVFG